MQPSGWPGDAGSGSECSDFVVAAIGEEGEGEGNQSCSVEAIYLSGAKVHSHSIDPQKNRRNYLITRSI